MIARRTAQLLLVLLGGCDVDSTVGYNESTAVDGLSCSEDALGRCDTGACAVTQVFDAPNGSITLAADDTDLFYLASERTLGKHSLASGTDSELAASDSNLRRMTSDATHVYWTELNGEVRGVAKAGGARFDAGYVFGNPTDIAVDATHLYWVFPEFGQVAMAPKPSGEATHISGQASPEAITTDATHVYWVNSGTGPLTGELMRALRGDLTTAELVLSGLDAPRAIAPSAEAVYFASSTAVFRWVKGATVAEIVATDLSETKGIAVHGATVYGVGMEGLWRVAKAGGRWQQLERRPMSAIAFSCSGVYASAWFERGLVRYGP